MGPVYLSVPRQSLKMAVTLKLVCLLSAAVASSYGQSQYASYPTWLQEGAQKASEQDQSPATQGYADALGVKQDLDFLEDIDPMTATIGVGVGNLAATTVVGLVLNSRITDTCNKVNEVLNVASLSLTTSTISDSVAKTAVQALETKINEILAKSTLTC